MLFIHKIISITVFMFCNYVTKESMDASQKKNALTSKMLKAFGHSELRSHWTLIYGIVISTK